MWKQATITASVSSVSDLRPIPVTPVISRVGLVERLVVRDYLITYVSRENLIDQYAYIKLPVVLQCAYCHKKHS